LLGEETSADMSKGNSDLYCSYQQTVTKNLSKCLLYIRFESGYKDDHWDLFEIKITVDVGSEHIVFSALGEKSYLWFGFRWPKIMFLEKLP